jgi:outer membrane protein OmpA-like peptidoglycan-associated protein
MSTFKRLSILTVVLLVAFIGTPLFLGCDSLKLTDSKTVKLEEQVKTLQTELETTLGKVKALEEENARLLQENQELKGNVTSLNHLVENCKMKLEDKEVMPNGIGRITFKISYANNESVNDIDTAIVASVINNLAQENNNQLKVTIKGYASKVGTEAYNLTLSKKRANGVAKAILSTPAGPHISVTTIGLGETDDDERQVLVIVEAI